ncbi:MAG: signal peptide peptidase SppA, partial [Dehalococcoidia bacterium]
MLFVNRPHIAVIELFGMIGGGPRMGNFLRLVNAVRDSRRARAVVLDVDSPGGLATTSLHLNLAITKLAARKPVVAFIRGTGASGAYMACAAATRIVALPAALVGSIGVISVRPLVPQLLERMGVSFHVAKGGRLKDMGAFWREPTPEEQEKEEALVNSYYQDFIDTVSRSRKMERGRVEELATGEVFPAVRARELGLVDELGDTEKAIEIAASLAG